MKKYDVVITETLDKHIIIEANNAFEAKEKVQEMYNNEEIVLDYTDLTQQEIEVMEEVK